MSHNAFVDLRQAVKSAMPQSMIEAAAATKFLAKKTFANSGSLDVPEFPHFDEESTAYFMDQLNNCTFYLEYGTGGSTVQAARKGISFVAVESDLSFMNSVQNKIGQLRYDQKLIAIDTGLTGSWGVPLFKTPKKSRQAKWRQYPAAPWTLITEQQPPDLILIDGRFRVACALTCIKHTRHRSRMKLLIDDYDDRPFYHIVERFARLTTTTGRMAVFGTAPFDADDLDRELESHYSDWR